MEDIANIEKNLLNDENIQAAPLNFTYYSQPQKNEYLSQENLLPDDDDKTVRTYKYTSVELTPEEEEKAKVILLIGQTGNGKTTLINFLINTLLGVEYEDDFRFKIVVEKKRLHEAQSNTEGVNCYNIRLKGYPFPIKIIDSQGVGDTRGIELDEQLIPKIKEIFLSVNHINCICFIVKETDIRLPSSQQYIYKTCLDVFAKDVNKNFILMLTNSHFQEDPNDIPVLKTLNLKESFFNTVIPYLDKPYYFQFENGTLFSKKKNNINKLYFEESMENMNKFLQEKLVKLKHVHTKNCAFVCIERIQQRLICENLLRIRESLVKKKKLIEETQCQILKEKDKIAEDPNIKIIDYEIIYKKRNLPNGKHSTVCNYCKTNCHSNCTDTRIFGLDFLKYTCLAFNLAGFCKICGCFFYSHESSAQYEYYEEKKPLSLSLEELFKKKCQSSPEAKSRMEQLNEIICKENEEIIKIKKEADMKYEELESCLRKLNDLALNPSNFQLTLNMYDQLIQQEEQLENSVKIENLKKQREQYIIMKETAEKEKGKEFGLYIRTQMEEYKIPCSVF